MSHVTHIQVVRDSKESPNGKCMQLFRLLGKCLLAHAPPEELRRCVFMSHTWMRHVTRMNEACHTYEWGMAHIWMSHVTHLRGQEPASSCPPPWELWQCVSMSFIPMSHVTHMNESCHTYEWDMSHIWISHVTKWMSHVTHMNESCHTYEWVMSHVWISHITHMKESCHINEWDMSHIWMGHVTHVNESCHSYEWVMSHTYEAPRYEEERGLMFDDSDVTESYVTCHLYEPPRLNISPLSSS